MVTIEWHYTHAISVLCEGSDGTVSSGRMGQGTSWAGEEREEGKRGGGMKGSREGGVNKGLMGRPRHLEPKSVQ
jgi:hypothetical protein